MNEDTVIIRGSYGAIVAEKQTGDVVKVYPISTKLHDNPITKITKIDLEEYRDTVGPVPAELDILEVGFWEETKTPTGVTVIDSYVPPDYAFREGYPDRIKLIVTIEVEVDAGTDDNTDLTKRVTQALKHSTITSKPDAPVKAKFFDITPYSVGIPDDEW